MKVCHITTVHSNRYDPRIFERECTALAENGHEVFLLINDTLPNEIKNGVGIVSLNLECKNRFDRVRRIAKEAYRKAIDLNAEVYHIHDPELLGIGGKLRKIGKKVIFDSHEFTAMQILTKEYIPKPFRKMMSNFYRGYEKRTLKKFSGVICPCTYEGKDYFENVNVPKIIIGNYPSLKTINQALLGMEHKKREEKICYVGSIDKSRGVFHMVKAAAMAGVRLALIGQIPENVREELESMPEFKNVECFGLLSHEEALREVAKCKVGLALLQNKGQYAKLDNLPTKVYEYMALGIPMVVSNFPFYRNVLEKYKFASAVNPENDIEISNAIKEILHNPKLQEQMAIEGTKAVEREMNWEIESQKLIRFYSKI